MPYLQRRFFSFHYFLRFFLFKSYFLLFSFFFHSFFFLFPLYLFFPLITFTTLSFFTFTYFLQLSFFFFFYVWVTFTTLHLISLFWFFNAWFLTTLNLSSLPPPSISPIFLLLFNFVTFLPCAVLFLFCDIHTRRLDIVNYVVMYMEEPEFGNRRQGHDITGSLWFCSRTCWRNLVQFVHLLHMIQKSGGTALWNEPSGMKLFLISDWINKQCAEMSSQRDHNATHKTTHDTHNTIRQPDLHRWFTCTPKPHPSIYLEILQLLTI